MSNIWHFFVIKTLILEVTKINSFKAILKARHIHAFLSKIQITTEFLVLCVK